MGGGVCGGEGWVGWGVEGGHSGVRPGGVGGEGGPPGLHRETLITDVPVGCAFPGRPEDGPHGR